MHLLLTATESDRIELPEGTAFQFTFSGDSKPLEAASWLDADVYALNLIQPAFARYAAKLQLDEAPLGETRVGDESGSQQVSGAGPLASSLGLWPCRGGWPSAPGVHHIAIEPTSAPVNDLLAAREVARSVTIPARGKVTWQTRAEVEPPFPQAVPFPDRYAEGVGT
jgi:hypothetical protein